MLYLQIFLVLIILLIIFVYIYYSRESKLTEAIAFYENGDYNEALELLEVYSSAKPNSIEAKKYLSKIYNIQKSYTLAIKQAISIANSRYSTNKEKADAYAFVTSLHIKQENYEKAIAIAKKGFRLDPKNINLHYQLGILYMKNEKNYNAIKEFNLVLNKDRTHIDARMNLAKLHHELHHENKERYQYKRILEIDPTYDEARYKMAEVDYSNQKYNQVIERLEKIKEVDEDRKDDYYYMLVNSYIKTKNETNLRELLEKAVLGNDKKNEKVTFMRYELALIYEEEDMIEEAYNLYQKIRLDIPNYRDIKKRINRLKKTLHPEEYEKMISRIDYSSLATSDFKDLYYDVLKLMRYKEHTLIKDSRNVILSLCVEKFKSLLQGRYLIEMIKSPSGVTGGEVKKFYNEMIVNDADKGILISTSKFTEKALEIAKEHDIELMDKINIFELIGE
ncbi:MAG: restriction endonuclease [Fusobacteriota bacterium]